MQSTAVASSVQLPRKASLLRRLLSGTPVNRYYISQDGEIISRGSVRYSFVTFCDEDGIAPVLGDTAIIGKRIGYVKDGGTSRLWQLITDTGSYILVKGPLGSEVFKQII